MKWTNEMLLSHSSWYNLGSQEFAVKATFDRWGSTTKGIDGMIAIRCMDCTQNGMDMVFTAETVKEGHKQAEHLREFGKYLCSLADSLEGFANTIVEESDREMN